jgi:hypothetical protein
MPTNTNNKPTRFWTQEERREAFLTMQAESLKQMVDEEANSNTGPSRWHQLSDPITEEEDRELPDAISLDNLRTPTLWVKFYHPRIGKRVVSMGHLDYDGGEWSGLLRADDDIGNWGPTEPRAWAYIFPGEAPEWDGIVIRQKGHY